MFLDIVDVVTLTSQGADYTGSDVFIGEEGNLTMRHRLSQSCFDGRDDLLSLDDIRSVGEYSLNVRFRQMGILTDDFFRSQSAGEELKHELYRDPSSLKDGLATQNSWIEHNPLHKRECITGPKC